MKGVGRVLVFALGGALCAVVIAVAWYALTFDPNAYRDDIAALVRDATGRELVIEGDLEATLFPKPGLAVGRVRLGQAPGFGSTPFVTLTHADADLRLWPLVRFRRIEFGRVRVQGLALELHRGPDGASNWADLLQLARGGKVPEARLMPGSIELSAAEIDEATVHYVDDQKRRQYDLSDGSLALNGIAIGAPFALDARFRVASGDRAAQVRTRADVLIAEDGGVGLKTPSVVLEIPAGGARDGIEIALEAPVARYAGDELRVDAPRVEIKSGPESHIQVSGSLAAQSLALVGNDALDVTAPALDVELQGEHLPRGGTRLRAEAPALAARVEAQTLSVNELSAEAAGLQLQATVAATGMIDAPRLAGRVTLAPFSPRVLMETLGRPLASIADPAALARADLTAQYELSTTALRLYDLKLTLDESNITGELTLNDFVEPALRFDLAADRLVFDRYVSRGALDTSGGTAASGHGLSLTTDGLGALDVEGSLQVAELVLAGVRASDVTLSVHGGDGPATSASATVPGNPRGAISAKD